ncbi:conserved membrane protein in copper uptake, YcnI [Leifsonia rubra CMS 76R]|nr:conserved membrane protein in copper uptake, YcnI [Leifsonia rubra CMS 76R]
MKTFTKAAPALTAEATLALAAPLAALAHVSIEPGHAEPGAYAFVTVKVPNESEPEKTNRVELKLPEPVMVGESEITEEGSEKPAPVLYVTDEPAGHHDAAATDADAHTGDQTAVSDRTEAATSSDPAARGLGIAGLVAGLGAVVLAFAFRSRTNKEE